MEERFRYRCQEGQDVVEFALVLPFLMFLLVGIVELGLAVWHYDTISNAAREVARCGIIYTNVVSPNSIEMCIDTSINQWGHGLGLTSSDFDVTWPPETGTIRVQVDYDYQPVVGLVIDGTLGFRTVATMQTEYTLPPP